MKTTLSDLYNFIYGELKKTENYLLEEKKDLKKIDRKEWLSVLFLKCLVEDIETLHYLKNNKFKNRYINSLIRMISEQVIEYLYIMNHQELITIYFGEKIDENLGQSENLFEELKRTGQARFGRRKTVKEMANDIGEVESSDDKISLYDIYSIKSELEHNCYFHSIFDVIEEIETTEEVEEDLDDVFMCYILSAFIAEYCDQE